MTGIFFVLILGWLLGVVMLCRKPGKKEQSVVRHQTETTSSDSPIDAYINDIKNADIRDLCRRAKREIEKTDNYIKVDVGLGYLRFNVNGTRIASIYADKDFFWLDTGPGKWKGTKIIDNETLTKALEDVKQTFFQLKEERG